MLYTGAILIAGNLMAKMMHLFFWFLGMLMVRAFILHLLRRSKNERDKDFPRENFTALLGGLLYSSIPALLILSCWSFTDAAIAVYFTAFIFASR
jgi:hypothetical protein